MTVRWVVVAWGVLFACVGAWVVLQPRGLVDFADLFLTPAGLWFAVALRLVVGALLWIAAEGSRTPRIFRVLGALFVLSAIALPAVGLERMQRLASWGAGLADPTLRAVGLVVVALAAFIAWSAWPREADA